MLDQVRQAAGGAAWDGLAALSIEANETSSSMKGRWTATEDLKLGQEHQASDFGFIRTQEVWSDRGHWRQDISGGVHPIDSDFAKQLAATDAWMIRRAYLKAGHGGATFGEVMQREDGGRRYDVMTATPPSGAPIELWFDAGTHLLARTKRALSINTETVTYDGYRTVDGRMLPFSVTTDEDDPDSLDIVKISRYQPLPAAAANAFAEPVAPDDTTVAGGKVTIPIEFDGEIAFNVMLNGKGPFTFIIDTGGHDILTPEAAKALGVTPQGSGSSGGAGEGTLSQQYAHIDTLAIGGVTIKNQDFFVIPMGTNFADRGARPPLAGLLGLELFERMAITIDYVGQTMTFDPLAAYHHTGEGTAVPIAFSDDIPLVPATLESHPGIFAIDTGNSGSLVVQHVWSDAVGLTDRMKNGLAMSSFGAGGESKNWASRMGTLTLGGNTVMGFVGRYSQDKKGAFSSISEAGNIGNEILPNFVVTFDYAHEKMWLEPRPGFRPPLFSRSGMSLSKAKPEVFTVVNTIAGGPAEGAGLKKGDVVTAIDGQPAKTLSGRDVLRLMTRAEGTKVAVDYTRDGKPAKAELVLKVLLP
ncbi:MAG TPA: aspartyl protease family protein [Alphaproteobacteria bacterium]|nr:aspartyl protease family protein [Alphaproteobacteria bacterium]